MNITIPESLIHLDNKTKYILSLFAEQQERQLSAVVLKEKLGNTYSKILSSLISDNVLSITSQHLSSIKSRTYRLSDDLYNGQWVSVDIPELTFRRKKNINKYLLQQQKDLNKASFNPEVLVHIANGNSNDKEGKVESVLSIVDSKATIGKDTFSARSYGAHTALSHDELLYMTVEGESVVIGDMSASIIACLFGALLDACIVNKETIKLRRYIQDGFWDSFGWTKEARKKNKKDIITHLNMPIKQYFGCINNPANPINEIANTFPNLFRKVIPSLKRKHGDSIISAMFMRMESKLFIKAIKSLQSQGIWCVRHHDSIIVKRSDKDIMVEELRKASLEVLRVDVKMNIDILPEEENQPTEAAPEYVEIDADETGETTALNNPSFEIQHEPGIAYLLALKNRGKVNELEGVI